MREYQEKYLDLLAELRRDADVPTGQESAQALLNDVSQATGRSREQADKGMALLRAELFPALDNIFSASAEDIADLQEFADKLMQGVAQKDSALAYRIHMALVNYARQKNDRDMLIRELYWVGMGLYNMETSLSPGGARLFTYRMRLSFAESASYFETAYDDITDPEIRGYIHRSMGNLALTYSTSNLDDAKAKLAATMRSIRILSDPEIRAKTPSLPWDRYLYLSHQEQTTMLAFLRQGGAEPDMFVQVMESAQLIQQKQMEQARERGEPLQPRWQYTYYAALYHCGAISLEEFLDVLYALSTARLEDDFDPQSMFSHLSAPAMFMEYSKTLSQRKMAGQKPRVKKMLRRMFRWLAQVPGSDYARQMGFYLRQVLYAYRELPGCTSYYDLLLNVFACQHPTGYARMWRTAQIARALCRWAIKDCPEQFVGFMDCADTAVVAAKAEELAAFAWRAGRVYDAGMVHCIDMVRTTCRGLLEEEFSLLQLHAYYGANLLSKRPSTAPYADVAYGHHCHYDEQGGYPVSFSPGASPARAMIYIISVADTVSAATDSVGRYYSPAKDLEELYGELKDLSGTWYAPFVVDLLADPARREELKKDLDRWIGESYEDLFRRRQEMMK